MTHAPPNLVLLGLRAAGKSTVGHLLSRRLARPFIELDDRAAALLSQATPSAAITHLGLPAFREAEADALRPALSSRGQILALGGGTPTAPGAEEALRNARRGGDAILFYLRVGPATLRARLAATDLAARPSLTGAGTLEEIDALFAQRDPLYRSLADHTLDAAALAPADLAAAIARIAGP